MTPGDIARLLAGHRFRVANEAELQVAIEDVLRGAGLAFDREVRLGARDRIDFLASGIGVEVKVDGSAGAVLGQLRRYADSPRIHALLLVTTRMTHAVQMPKSIGGKSLDVVRIGGIG